MTILVACGLKREAAIIERCWGHATAVPGGGDGARLERMLEARAGAASAIFSIGIAGALDPALRVGDVVIDGDVVLPGTVSGVIIGRDRIAATAAEKAILRAETRAAAVDMESHVAARVAARCGLPFTAIRAISDAAEEALPPAALVGMAPDGGLALGAVLVSLARRPGQLPGLLRLGKNTSLALRNLAEVLEKYANIDSHNNRSP